MYRRRALFAVVVAAAGLSACSGSSDPTTNIHIYSATLNAHGECDGGTPTPCGAHFQHRIQGASSWTTDWSTDGVQQSTGSVPLSDTIYGLAPDTTYEEQFCGHGDNVSSDYCKNSPPSTFTTPSLFASDSPWNIKLNNPPVDAAKTTAADNYFANLNPGWCPVTGQNCATIPPDPRFTTRVNHANNNDPVATVVCGQPPLNGFDGCSSSHPTSWHVPSSGVEIPPGSGSPTDDLSTVIINDDTDQALEFWRTRYDQSSQTLSGTSVVQFDLTGSGWCTSTQCPHGISANAAGGSLMGGLITPDDVKSGVIKHALALVIPETTPGTYCPPATGTDGSSGVIPEGAHLFLPASYTIPSSWSSKFKMIAQALKDYGAFVTDKGSWDLEVQGNGNWSGTTWTSDQRETYPTDFPWSQLEVVSVAGC